MTERIYKLAKSSKFEIQSIKLNVRGSCTARNKKEANADLVADKRRIPARSEMTHLEMDWWSIIAAVFTSGGLLSSHS
ncbi:hypothetical protein E2986_13921 [Frieseomelitta varia]|uniref:Uncharacterized protein n=1 Tax=Frieseomelitta varia TaxID=561572 RepID=A0A833SAJ4_9HYME|nr:hypothetical protein E2986_13921 [Frieseomelitta varia]